MTQPFEEECEPTTLDEGEIPETPHDEDNDPEAQAGEEIDVDLPDEEED